MAYTGEPKKIEHEQLGSFSGYIRRPVPSVSGMTAQIFGENGDDADTILALSLSKFQDAEVFVNIYLVKNSLGQIMKDNGSYPLISSFIGFVRRSMPKKDGMVAQFFSPNGNHADSIAELSKSEYQDCLVFVDVRGKKSTENKQEIDKQNIDTINANYLGKVTINERADYARKEKQFRKMNEHLELSDFLNKIEVFATVGTSEDFKSWLQETQTCSFLQEKHCLNHSGTVEVLGLLQPYNFLPICGEHLPLLTQDSFEKNKLYYEMKHRLLLKQWVWHFLKKNFSFDGKSEPEPDKIIGWAASKNIAKYLPKKYQGIL